MVPSVRCAIERWRRQYPLSIKFTPVGRTRCITLVAAGAVFLEQHIAPRNLLLAVPAIDRRYCLGCNRLLIRVDYCRLWIVTATHPDQYHRQQKGDGPFLHNFPPAASFTPAHPWTPVKTTASCYQNQARIPATNCTSLVSSPSSSAKSAVLPNLFVQLTPM